MFLKVSTNQLYANKTVSGIISISLKNNSLNENYNFEMLFLPIL